jgi:hypothetical protein
MTDKNFPPGKVDRMLRMIGLRRPRCSECGAPVRPGREHDHCGIPTLPDPNADRRTRPVTKSDSSNRAPATKDIERPTP